MTQLELVEGLIPPAVRRNHWNQQFVTHAQTNPDGLALKDPTQTLTWQQAARAIDSVAAGLSQRGVAFGDRVAIVAPNHVDNIIAALAVNRLGAIFVPINIRLTAPEMAYILQDSGAKAVFVESALFPTLDAAIRQPAQGSAGPLRVERTIVFGDESNGPVTTESFSALLSADSADFSAPDVPESSTCIIMYTSGTTGRPKGAMLDHINMFSQATTVIRVNEVGADDVNFLTAPLFHIAAWGSISGNFVMGSSVYVYPLGSFDPVDVLDAYEREGATIVFNVPQQWQQLCAAKDAGRSGGGDWNLRLRLICWGAAPASEQVLRAMEHSFPDAKNVAVFGQTELAPITCYLGGSDSLRKLGSIGRPLPTQQFRIVDPLMEDVKPGQVGEIVYLGPNLMKGYWNKPEETAKAFAGGWFHSGDLVRADDEGFLYIVDRAKDMVISGGENVYCTEVENVLFDHPAVLEAAVYGRPDEKWGEIPVAAVALREGNTLTLDELRAWLDDRLARFKHPKDLVFVDALPRNAGGKVQKFQLRETYSTESAGAAD